MLITFVICILSVILCTSYIVFGGRAIKKRTNEAMTANGQITDEELLFDIEEYRSSVTKLTAMSAIIIIATIATMFIM